MSIIFLYILNIPIFKYFNEIYTESEKVTGLNGYYEVIVNSLSIRL